MQDSARISAAIEMLEALEQAWEERRSLPADGLMASYFRERRYIGSKDRGAISELVYLVLRHYGQLSWQIEHYNRASNPRRKVMAALYFLKNFDSETISALFDDRRAHAPTPLADAELGLLERWEGKSLMDKAMPPHVQRNLPEWIWRTLKAEYPDELEALARAMQQQSPVDLRVNLRKCPSREALIEALARDGYEALPTPLSPLGVRLAKRLPAHTTQAFNDGMYEMQDEGSQLLAQLVEAEKGQRVIDFCAGAGGKTLAIAARMQNKGKILAWDTSERRLMQIKKRLARAGIDNVQVQVIRDENDTIVKRQRGEADWVLVDAPCTGSGTWRRNPDSLWRLQEEEVAEMAAIQARILEAAGKLVKTGGMLVYATCSLFGAENYQQVADFLAKNPEFKVAPLPQICSNLGKVVAGIGPALRLTPHQDGTDGFFGIRLQRHSAP